MHEPGRPGVDSSCARVAEGRAVSQRALPMPLAHRSWVAHPPGLLRGLRMIDCASARCPSSVRELLPEGANSDQNGEARRTDSYGFSWRELELVTAFVALITQRSLDSKGSGAITPRVLISSVFGRLPVTYRVGMLGENAVAAETRAQAVTSNRNANDLFAGKWLRAPATPEQISLWLPGRRPVIQCGKSRHIGTRRGPPGHVFADIST